MEIRVYDVSGQTFGRLTLDKGVTQQDVVRSMRKGQLQLAPVEPAKPAKPVDPKAGQGAAGAGAGSGAAANR